MPAVSLRRFALGLLAVVLPAAQVACAQAAPTFPTAVQLPAPAVWLASEGPQVYVLTAQSELLTVLDGGAKVLAKNFSSTFITACSGRVVGVSSAGQLQVWNGRTVETAQKTDLSPLAHPVCLLSGVVAVSRAGDLVRFDPAIGGWREAARTAANALPDAQLTLADLDGQGDAVVALTQPSSGRYAHGILGDTAEATRITVFERHGLGVLARLSLPAPFVFEDLQARPVRLTGGKDALAVVRSSPRGGAALALVSKGPDGLGVQATGPDFGQTSRWLAPAVGFGQLWAVKTPHIGGLLAQYAQDTQTGDTLKVSPPFTGVSSHSIGSRNLNAAVLTAPGQPVVPSQNHRSLLALDCRAACRVTGKLALGGTYSSNLLLSGGQVWVGDSSGKLHGWAVN